MPELPGFRFLEAVASGSSGTVYRARQEDLDREVAVKILAPGLFDEAQTRARFLREARIQARLSHPCLVTLYDAGVSVHGPYLVTEFVAGGTLRARLASSGALPVAESLRIGVAVASGLACAHEAGIVHRDLKPENVLVTLAGEIKLTDFGLARELRASDGVLTAAGVILGTPGYLAPEVLEGAEATAAADIFALGVILFELSAGRPPFTGATVADLLQAQLTEAAPSLLEFDAAAPSGLAALIGRCLQRDPRVRPSDATEVARQLEALRQGGEPVEAHLTTPLRAARTPSRPGPARCPASRARPTVTLPPRTPAQLAAAPDSRWAVFGIAIALLASLIAGWALWPERPPAGDPAAVAPPARNAAGPGVVTPELTCLSVSHRAVRLQLEPPPGAEGRVELHRAGETSGRLVFLRPGESVAVVGGLTPDSEYEGRWQVSGGRGPLRFRTLPSAGVLDTPLLDRDVKSADSFALSARGQQLLVAYRVVRGGRDHLVLLESPDRGETWRTPFELPVQTPSLWRLGLEHCGPGRVVVAWCEQTRPLGVLRLGMLDLTQPRRQFRELTTANVARPIALAGLDADEVGFFTSGDGQLVVRRILERGTRALPEETLCGLPDDVEKLMAVRTDHGPGLLLITGDGTPQVHRYWWTCRGATGRWSEPVVFASAEGKMHLTHAGGAAAGQAVLLTWEYQNRVYVRVSQDGGATFLPPIEPVRTEESVMRPALTWASGNFYLAMARTTQPLSPRYLELYRSRDGLAWTRVARRQLARAIEEASRITRLVGFDDRVVAIASDRRMGVMAITFALPP